MQFIFVEFWVAVDFTRYGVNHGHCHFVFGIEVMQTNCTFQFNRYFSETSYYLRGRVDNVSVAFFKSVSILLFSCLIICTECMYVYRYVMKFLINKL